jgi:hypothetical protein
MTLVISESGGYPIPRRYINLWWNTEEELPGHLKQGGPTQTTDMSTLIQFEVLNVRFLTTI